MATVPYSIFRGADKTLTQLRKLKAFMPNAFEAALYQEAQIELTECKKRTPVDTGALRASEHVEGPTREGRKIAAAIVAGGPSAPYALTVHEDLEMHHPRGGQAKYIESTLNESRPFLPDRIAKRIEINKAL